MKYIITNNIQGDCVETGVWRGGATIFMRSILKAYKVQDRFVWVCDSFEGIPPSNAEKYPADEGLNWDKTVIPFLAVSLEQVQEDFVIVYQQMAMELGQEPHSLTLKYRILKNIYISNFLCIKNIRMILKFLSLIPGMNGEKICLLSQAMNWDFNI